MNHVSKLIALDAGEVIKSMAGTPYIRIEDNKLLGIQAMFLNMSNGKIVHASYIWLPVTSK